jgi:Type I phosphodiesterase / nucleotide pyrophosphatase
VNASHEPDRRVDELREQLRSLGYLEARVDRFVLGGALSRTRPLGFVLTASLRIGLLAGLPLGPAAAIGLRSRLPGLITSASDAVVVAIYLAVFFALAFTVVAAVAVWLGSLAVRGTATGADVSRRARRSAAAAGVVVGLVCVTYLTLWWRAATGLGSTSLAWSLTVLAVAAAISMLIGHAVAVTVLALLARRGLAGSLPPGSPLSSAKATVSLGVIALGGAVALLVATAPATRAGPAPSLTVVPTGLRVIVLAVDGVDAATLDRLRATGRLPIFDRLFGQSIAKMPSEADRDPARTWTTVATGQPPDRHGIRALESRQVAGLEGRLRTDSPGWAAIVAATDVLRLTRPTTASGDERLIPAFWEVASTAGLRTAVVHWWATWPAPEQAGIVLSDRAILRLEHQGTPNAEIGPPALYETLRVSWSARRQRAVARAQSLALAGMSDTVLTTLRRSAELDATVLDLATDPNLGTPDLLAVYLPGLDIAQHALLGTPDAAGLAPSAAAERVASLERYYEVLDDSIGRLLDASPADKRLVIVVTQPGRVTAPGDGLLSVSGAPAGRDLASADVTSVAATVLYSLGVPIARDLASSPALSLFAPAFVTSHPVRDVATYGPRQVTPRTGAGQPLDKEMIERMRSLGYVR